MRPGSKHQTDNAIQQTTSLMRVYKYKAKPFVCCESCTLEACLKLCKLFNSDTIHDNELE